MAGKIKYTNEELLNNLRLVADNLGYTPGAEEYAKHPMSICHYSVMKDRFKTWNNALITAGLKPKLIRNISEKDMLKSIKNVAKEIGRGPTATEYDASSIRICNSKTICDHFKSKWKDVLRLAKVSLSAYESLSADKLLEDLYNVAIRNPSIHAITTLIRKANHSDREYLYFFKNCKNIRKMLYIKYGIKTEFRKHLCDDLYSVLSKIKEFKKNNGRNPQLKEFQEYYGHHLNYLCKKNKTSFQSLLYLATGTTNRVGTSIYEKDMQKELLIKDIKKEYKNFKKVKSKYLTFRARILRKHNENTFIIHFGSMKEAFKAAKIDETLADKRFTRKIYSNEDIIKNVQYITKKYRHIPTCDEYEMSPLRLVSLSCVQDRFGSWNAFIKSAGFQISTDRNKIKKTDIIKNLQEAYNLYQKIFTQKEFNAFQNKICSARTVYDSFGSWNKALIAAGLLEEKKQA